MIVNASGMSIGIGISLALDTLCPQANGAKKYKAPLLAIMDLESRFLSYFFPHQISWLVCIVSAAWRS